MLSSLYRAGVNNFPNLPLSQRLPKMPTGHGHEKLSPSFEGVQIPLFLHGLDLHGAAEAK